jgi:DNA-binding transcriptional MerR regulator
MLVRYRVDELAAASGVSVDTVRFYQGKGLLAAPRREGRVAWYGAEHLKALGRIRDLKAKGFSLASIRRMLSGDLDPADEALVSALADAGGRSEGWLTLEELARRTGVSPALLAAIEQEGLLVPHVAEGRPLYSEGDAQTIAAGLRLLEAGIPLGELLALARAHEQAMQQVAERAVDLFDRFVRRPLLATSVSKGDAASKITEAFNVMFPATTALVAHHFGRVLLAAALARIEDTEQEPEPAGSSGSSREA